MAKPGMESRAGYAQRFAEPYPRPDIPALTDEAELHIDTLAMQHMSFYGDRAPPLVLRPHVAGGQSQLVPSFISHGRGWPTGIGTDLLDSFAKKIVTNDQFPACWHH